MGTYLSKPITDKESSEGEDQQFRYGVAAMQGWRASMEDAHATVLDVADEQGKPSNVGFFGVFDGHGGKEVALFAAKTLVSQLVRTEEWKAGQLTEAISQAYLKFDESLHQKDQWEELHKLAGGDDNKDSYPSKEMDGEDWIGEGQELTGDQLRQVVARLGGLDDYEFGDEAEDATYDPLSELEEGGKLGGDLGSEDVMTRDDSDDEADQEEASMAETSENPEESTSNDSEIEGDMLHSSDKDERSASWERYRGPSAGCTAVVAMVSGNSLIVANAGDSRCVASREGKAHAMSRDHKPTDKDEAARIVKAGGFITEGRVNGSLNLSRALGDMEFKVSKDLPATAQMITADPEVRTLQLQPGDEFLILACDGIWDVLSNQQAVDFVREGLQQGLSPKAVCEAMCDKCLAPNVDGCGEGCDNMSAMVVVLKGFVQDEKIQGAIPVPQPVPA